MNILRKLAGLHKGRHVLDGVAGCQISPAVHEEIGIDGRGGAKIYAHLHRPVASGRFPGVILVPGGLSAGTDYDGCAEISADETAALGCAVLHYDPSGRGRTGGADDFWGQLHQDELAQVVEYFAELPSVDDGNIGILSFSIGIAIAAAALARFSLPVRYLYDWEGPSNRFNITKNDTVKPLKRFPTTNDLFWNAREPSRFMAEVPCGYFRFQGEEDHMQGVYKGHAVELLNLATRGKAAWTKCNDNAPNSLFDPARAEAYSWVSPRADQKARMLMYLIEIQNHAHDGVAGGRSPHIGGSRRGVSVCRQPRDTPPELSRP